MKTPLGTEVDIGAGHIVLDGFPALREGGIAPPLLVPCLLWPRSLISATAELLLYNETFQQTFRPLLSKLYERRQFYVFNSHFEEVWGGVEPWLMARWKARVDFLLTLI